MLLSTFLSVVITSNLVTVLFYVVTVLFYVVTVLFYVVTVLFYVVTVLFYVVTVLFYGFFYRKPQKSVTIYFYFNLKISTKCHRSVTLTMLTSH